MSDTRWSCRAQPQGQAAPQRTARAAPADRGGRSSAAEPALTSRSAQQQARHRHAPPAAQPRPHLQSPSRQAQQQAQRGTAQPAAPAHHHQLAADELSDEDVKARSASREQASSRSAQTGSPGRDQMQSARCGRRSRMHLAKSVFLRTSPAGGKQQEGDLRHQAPAFSLSLAELR